MTDDPTTCPVAPTSLGDLEDLVGRTLGPTPWLQVTQDDVDAFAQVTGDEQWIHVDPVQAAASPFGSTVVHGLFTLSLGPAFSYRLISFDGFSYAVNYGYDKVRFPSFLPTGGELRMSLTVLSATAAARGIELKLRQTFERAGAERPIAVAETIVLVGE